MINTRKRCFCDTKRGCSIGTGRVLLADTVHHLRGEYGHREGRTPYRVDDQGKYGHCNGVHATFYSLTCRTPLPKGYSLYFTKLTGQIRYFTFNQFQLINDRGKNDISIRLVYFPFDVFRKIKKKFIFYRIHEIHRVLLF